MPTLDRRHQAPSDDKNDATQSHSPAHSRQHHRFLVLLQKKLDNHIHLRPKWVLSQRRARSVARQRRAHASEETSGRVRMRTRRRLLGRV